MLKQMFELVENCLPDDPFFLLHIEKYESAKDEISEDFTCCGIPVVLTTESPLGNVYLSGGYSKYIAENDIENEIKDYIMGMAQLHIHDLAYADLTPSDVKPHGLDNNVTAFKTKK